ncbi:HAD family hydrolase [Streptomyces sp. NBC_00102]|uniref:HAD family hydrolase n=1 Tax=Streptomyces sp. NBC_00102 TaxID=2975652 RepID=UPI002253ADB6|nr:HAD family hydrolase [Streptomyces sp. NBC_00102]MCX5397190.1 HAD family hydrolase [Streptomyces sp. NBC_00102]
MTKTSAAVIATIATDVGGVLYYDEPFELAWLQGVLERAGETDPHLTIEQFTAEMNRFYLQRAHSTASPGLYSPAGTHAWIDVRRRWTDLAQPVPGAVAALADLAAERPVCVVANQPPECEEVLRAGGVAEHLVLIALDASVGVAKPDPGLLGWAIEKLGWDASTTLMVGDRPDHDAAPAERLGAHAALVTPPSDWIAPAGVEPGLVAAYQRVRAERLKARWHPAADRSLHIRDLSDLATRLGQGQHRSAVSQ